MKPNEFMRKVEIYYGMLYRHAQALELEPYLGNLDNSWLLLLFDMTIRNFSIARGLLPDIAIFEQLKKDFQARGEELDNRHSSKIITSDERIIPKGYEAKPYFDAIWNAFPEQARFRRACKWEQEPSQDEIREKIL